MKGKGGARRVDIWRRVCRIVCVTAEFVYPRSEKPLGFEYRVVLSKKPLQNLSGRTVIRFTIIKRKHFVP